SSVTADVELRYDEDSGSVIAGGVEQVPRITYELQADVPTHDPAASPRSVDTSDVPAAYSEDPLLSREARAWLAEVERTIPEGATLIERARALQDVFRGFTYDLEVDYSDRADPV